MSKNNAADNSKGLIMSEKEKMLAGKIYDPSDKELLSLRVTAHKLCKDYNETYETEVEKRAEILKKLLPNADGACYLQGPVYFDYGVFTRLGKNFYANFNFTVLDVCSVTIGHDVYVGPNVSILTPKHPLSGGKETLITKKTERFPIKNSALRLQSAITAGLPAT